jgi:predicted glycosyltransferase
MTDRRPVLTDSVPRPPDRRILLYSHDGTGLGHLRITLGVAGAYGRLRPSDSLLLLTGSLQAGAFALPANLDFVKLPAMPKRDLYGSLPPTEGFTGSHNSTIRFRAAVALATFQGFDPHLVVVDHAPGGLFRELATTFDWMRGRGRRPRFALLMRDITFGPEQTRDIWTNEGAYPLLDEWYDRILVYGDRQVFDPIVAYDMSPAAAAKTRFCGYLAPAPPRRDSGSLRAALGAGSVPLIVVSAGGGHDGAPVLRAYLAGLHGRRGEPVFSYVVTGPLLADPERTELVALARDLPDLCMVDFDPDFAAAVAAADVVVGMGGYNSLAEAVYFGKRPVVVPRLPGPQEQMLRAEGLGRLSLATIVRPEELTPSTLWAAIDDELRRGPPAFCPLSFDGLERIACELAQLDAH